MPDVLQICGPKVSAETCSCELQGLGHEHDALHARAVYVQEEIVAFVRRRSSAFSRGRSAFRGVSGHAGRWEARIGCFNGKKNVCIHAITSSKYIYVCKVM